MTKEELEKQTMEWKNNYILKLEKRCANYEMEISKMEKGICDICKETEKDKKIAELEKENAELKASRPKWHKVADGDVPKDENDVLVYSGEDWRMCVGKYFPKYKAWEAGCDTIAWCEIEPYKESE